MTYIWESGELDVAQREVRRRQSGASVTIEPRDKVFRLLLYLLQHRDRYVHREELCHHLWPDVYISHSVLDGVIKEARHVVGDDTKAPNIIRNRRGMGYRFIASVRMADTSFKAGHRYGFIVNLSHIYHLTVKDKTAQLATGRIEMAYDPDRQEISGQEVSWIEDDGISESEAFAQRTFKIRGHVNHDHLFYFGLASWPHREKGMAYSATFFDIEGQYRIRKELLGTMLCNTNYDLDAYVAPVLLTAEPLDHEKALFLLHRKLPTYLPLQEG